MGRVLSILTMMARGAALLFVLTGLTRLANGESFSSQAAFAGTARPVHWRPRAEGRVACRSTTMRLRDAQGASSAEVTNFATEDFPVFTSPRLRATAVCTLRAVMSRAVNSHPEETVNMTVDARLLAARRTAVAEHEEKQRIQREIHEHMQAFEQEKDHRGGPNPERSKSARFMSTLFGLVRPNNKGASTKQHAPRDAHHRSKFV